MTEEKPYEVNVDGPVRNVVQIRNVEGAVTIKDGDESGPVWARLLARCWWRAEAWLVESRVLPIAPRHQAERGYLEWFVTEFGNKNRGDLVYVALDAVPRLRSVGAAEWTPLPDRRVEIRRIRQSPWLLKGGFHNDRTSAQLAAASLGQRLVRDVARFLETAREPVILLGDPGSGKSTTLREVGIRVADRSLNRMRGLIPVYVALGSYREAFDDDKPADILGLVQRSIPASHSQVRESILDLIRDRRLLILFDGMDEMERTVYAQRVRKLSQFASEYAGRVRTLFACRTNDFLPTFRHRQLILREFNNAQIREYVRENFRLPVKIDGVAHNARQVTRRLVDSPELGDTVTNPLTLYLIRHFIDTRERWPEKRNELFSHYLDSILVRLRSYQAAAAGEMEEDVVRSSWRELAFEIARERGGIYLRMAQLRERWGRTRADTVVEWGLRSGLLTIEFASDALSTPTASHQTASTLNDSDSVGFFHHRIQEFLCAEHLASHATAESGMDWKQLVDSPRWQETLLYLVAVRGSQLDAMRILEESLDEIVSIFARIEARREELELELSKNRETYNAIKPERYESVPRGSGRPIYSTSDSLLMRKLDAQSEQIRDEIAQLKWSIASDHERVLSDRVMLTSKLLGELGPASAAGDLIGNKLREAVKQMAQFGRPTSQVKMLWSWERASNWIPMDFIRAPARSKIAWVREQAISVFASLAARRKHGASNLAEELAFDFATSNLLKRARTYIKATKGNPSKLAVVLWVMFWHIAYDVLALGGNFIISLYVARALPIDWIASLPFVGELSPSASVELAALLPLLIAFMSAPLTNRSTVWINTMATGCLGGGLIGLALWSGHPLSFFGWQPQDGKIFIFLQSVLLAIGPLLSAISMDLAVFLTAFSISMLFATFLSQEDSKVKTVFLALRERSIFVETFAYLIGAAAVVLWLIAPYIAEFYYLLQRLGVLSIVGTIFSWVLSVFFALLFGAIGLFLIAFVLFILYQSPRFLYDNWRSIPEFVGALLIGGLIVGAFYGLIVVTVYIAGQIFVPWKPVFWVVVGVIAAALVGWWMQRVYWLLRLSFVQYVGRVFFLSYRPISSDAWLNQFKSGSPYLQAFLLLTVSRTQLELDSDHELLVLFQRVEKQAEHEPTSTIYWRRRHELEEAVKQERVGKLQNPAEP